MICIIDCGSHWIAEIEQKLTELKEKFCVVKMDELDGFDDMLYTGIIISGSPVFLAEVDHTIYFERFGWIHRTSTPVLGICFGHQIIGILSGANMQHGDHIKREEQIEILRESPLFAGIKNPAGFQESHYESISVPDNFIHIAKSSSCQNEGMQHEAKNIYGVQFHPERSGENGTIVFQNFCNICRQGR